MLCNADYEKVIRKLFIDNGEYKFVSASVSQQFVEKLLSEAERIYKDEHYYRPYGDFREFLHTFIVADLAKDVFEGEYGDY